jgi:membrane protease YdiL (CAAX protease family)
MAIDSMNAAPWIRQGWIRAILFCIVYLSLLFTGFVYFPKVASLLGLGAQTPAPGEPDPLLWLKVLGLLMLSVLLVAVFRRLIDRKSFASLGFTRADYRSYLPGLFLPIVLLGTGSLILYLTRHIAWTDITFDGNALFIELGLMAMIAFYEELVFRGYILQNLMDSFGRWPALITSSFLFMIFHINNPEMGVLPGINIFLAGILLGINYIYTRDLWFAILFHFGWNFFQGPVLGYTISGFGFQTLLQMESKGPALVTGGGFGFEGSVVDTALSLIAILVLYRVFEKKYGNANVAGSVAREIA